MTPCTKRSYTSKKQARLATSTAHWRIRVYQCPDCYLFHVTNNEKADQKSFRREFLKCS